jgi:hypothetical protein
LFLLYRVQTRGTLRYWLGGWQPPWGIEYVIDGLNAYVLVVVLLMALICVVYSKRNIEHELPQKRITFYTLFQLLITGLCGITVTGDIFNMYVFIEIMSLSAYALTASEKILEGEFILDIGVPSLLFLLGIGFHAITGSQTCRIWRNFFLRSTATKWSQQPCFSSWARIKMAFRSTRLLTLMPSPEISASFRELSSKWQPTPSLGYVFGFTVEFIRGSPS